MSSLTSNLSAPVVVYIVHHPDSTMATGLAKAMFKWFRLGDLGGEAAGAGLPVYYRRQQRDGTMWPPIEWTAAELNVVIVLVDHLAVVDSGWREALISLAEEADSLKVGSAGKGRASGGKKQGGQKSTAESDGARARTGQALRQRALLLPVALHDSFYRTGPLYQLFNPVRLLDMSEQGMEAALRRAAMESTARELRSMAAQRGRRLAPLNVFLSHAKADGMAIAEQLRDGIRGFGQLVAWYDANDLPYGTEWASPMQKAAREGTAAMVATVTDAYPTRPWCRREAILARTPRKVRGAFPIWFMQPVVAVHSPGSSWVRGLPMLEGVPRIGWNSHSPEETTAQVVDRLVLEMMLVYVHRKVAEQLAAGSANDKTCFITWVPDSWSLIALRDKLGVAREVVTRIVYPGYGLTTAEIAELKVALKTFDRRVKLVSFEEMGK